MNQRKGSGRAARPTDTVGVGGVSDGLKAGNQLRRTASMGRGGRLQGAEPGTTAADKTQA